MRRRRIFESPDNDFEQNRILKRIKQRKLDAAKYLSSEHKYELRIGEINTRMICIMTGSKAKCINAENVIKFGNKTHDKLHKWCWLKYSE